MHVKTALVVMLVSRSENGTGTANAAADQVSHSRLHATMHQLDLMLQQLRDNVTRLTQQVLYRSFSTLAEWLACWTQAQKGPGLNRNRDAFG